MATTLILPPADALAAAASELTRQALAAGDTKRQIAINKGAYDLLVNAPAIVRITGGYLIPSSSRGGVVHRLDDLAGCSCEAGRAGRLCRHKVALELIEAAQVRTMPALPRRAPSAAYREAKRQMDELFA